MDKLVKAIKQYYQQKQNKEVGVKVPLLNDHWSFSRIHAHACAHL